MSSIEAESRAENKIDKPWSLQLIPLQGGEALGAQSLKAGDKNERKSQDLGFEPRPRQCLETHILATLDAYNGSARLPSQEIIQMAQLKSDTKKLSYHNANITFKLFYSLKADTYLIDSQNFNTFKAHNQRAQSKIIFCLQLLLSDIYWLFLSIEGDALIHCIVIQSQIIEQPTYRQEAHGPTNGSMVLTLYSKLHQ